MFHYDSLIDSTVQVWWNVTFAHHQCGRNNHRMWRKWQKFEFWISWHVIIPHNEVTLCVCVCVCVCARACVRACVCMHTRISMCVCTQLNASYNQVKANKNFIREKIFKKVCSYIWPLFVSTNILLLVWRHTKMFNHTHYWMWSMATSDNF